MYELSAIKAPRQISPKLSARKAGIMIVQEGLCKRRRKPFLTERQVSAILGRMKRLPADEQAIYNSIVGTGRVLNEVLNAAEGLHLWLLTKLMPLKYENILVVAGISGLLVNDARSWEDFEREAVKSGIIGLSQYLALKQVADGVARLLGLELTGELEEWLGKIREWAPPALADDLQGLEPDTLMLNSWRDRVAAGAAGLGGMGPGWWEDGGAGE